jgi:hypothetical protein
MSDDLRPYRRLDGGPGGFRLSDCPPEHRFHALIPRRTIEYEFLYRVPRHGERPAWIWWWERDGWPQKLEGTPFRFLERPLARAAEWFAEHHLPMPPILDADLRESREAASVAPIPPAADPAGPPRGESQATGPDTPGTVDQAPYDPRDLVTLDQAASMVHHSKRTLERYKTAGKLPAPAVEGGGGRADLYDWKVMRPWLESEFKIKLPEVFPANHRHA